ncbi:MAG: protein kinase, partial [Candidatus Hydrogenedentota bacterium]
MSHSDSLVGQTIGNYQVLRELGRGGMGVVYKAHEQSLQRVVALKVLPGHLAEDAAFVKRFLREAQAAARLSHPNIVHVYAVGQHAGQYFIAMEYVKGRS